MHQDSQIFIAGVHTQNNNNNKSDWVEINPDKTKDQSETQILSILVVI
jgi:hypothetical protein